MIELDGMSEEDLEALFDNLAMQRRYVAFSGSKVLSKSGQLGSIATPLFFGPMLRGRHIATVGAPYAIPGESKGQACCPHFANGAIHEGARDVVFQGRSVVMMGDRGHHWPSCDGEKVPGVVADGWKIAFWSERQFAF